MISDHMKGESDILYDIWSDIKWKWYLNDNVATLKKIQGFKVKESYMYQLDTMQNEKTSGIEFS